MELIKAKNEGSGRRWSCLSDPPDGLRMRSFMWRGDATHTLTMDQLHDFRLKGFLKRSAGHDALIPGDSLSR